MTLSVKFICYNSPMDKLTYHYNKKKKPAKTAGKFLYFYPCNEADSPNAHINGRPFIVLEVSESEWEALFELDRYEYNNTHAYERRLTSFPDKDEETLPPKEQERLINKDEPFTEQVHESADAVRLMGKLSDRELEVYNLYKQTRSQTQIAKMLGLSQGHISAVYNKAQTTLLYYELNASNPDEYVWKCWEMFVDKGKMPNFLDIEIEFVIRAIFKDLMPFFHWYYSIGELCRYIMKYYLFDEDKIEEDINKFKQAVNEEERIHFEDYYGDELPIIQGVYVRLYMEMQRRKNIGLSDSDKPYLSIYNTVEKIAKRLNMAIKEFATARFYPFFAKQRHKRIRQFIKNYPGKNST